MPKVLLPKKGWLLQFKEASPYSHLFRLSFLKSYIRVRRMCFFSTEMAIFGRNDSPMPMSKFPPTISKKQLKAFYNTTDYLLKKWIGKELLEQVGWVNKRCFSPEETRMLFERLSGKEYKAYKERQRIGEQKKLPL